MTDVQLLPLLGVPLENSLQLPAPSGMISTAERPCLHAGTRTSPSFVNLQCISTAERPCLHAGTRTSPGFVNLQCISTAERPCLHAGTRTSPSFVNLQCISTAETLPPCRDKDQPRLHEPTMHAVTQHPEHSAWFNVLLLPSWKP